jgi:hypothetical protein
LLGLHAWLALSATRDKSATFDEPLHMVGGYSYSAEGDFRLHPENGVLPQRWAGAALERLSPTLPREGYDEAWRTSDIAALSDGFLYGVGNDHRALLATARRAAILWSVALGIVVFAWAWTLWGSAGAFFALGLHAISPTILAHGALVTSDMSGALFVLLACWAWSQHLDRLTLGSLGLSAVVAGLAAIAKFSAAVLPPLFVLLALWKLVTQPSWTLHLSRPRELRGLGARAGWIAVAALVHGFVAACIIWAAFDFRFSPVGNDMPAMAQYYRLWSDALPNSGLMRSALVAMREWQVLPEAYIYGFGFVLRFAESRPAFLHGEFGSSGWWWFFPYAFAVKSTIAELLVAFATLGVAVAAWRARQLEGMDVLRTRANGVLPLIALAVTYLALSVTSSLNIGHRHLLLIYPILFIAAGGLVVPGAARWRRALALVVIVLGAIESFAVRPHYLAFFNAGVGGPAAGWRHLVDSSLDWGQDLPALVDWARANRRPDEALYYSIFGQRSAAAFGLQGTEIAPGYTERPRPWTEWGPGLYAISATNLQDVYSPFAGAWDQQRELDFQRLVRKMRAERERDPSLAVIGSSPELGDNHWSLERLQFARLVNYLRLRTPEATLGYSIFVHRLSREEARVLTSGLPREYLALLDQAEAQRR